MADGNNLTKESNTLNKGRAKGQGLENNTKEKGPASHRQRKRPPSNLHKSDNDIYVTGRSDFQAQLKKVIKLFDEGATEVTVHGLGHTVTRAANLSLQVQEKLSNTVDLSPITDTVELWDEWEPLTDEALPFTSTRSNSALHIRIARIAAFPIK